MAFSVSFITKYIKSLIEGDLRLKKVEVEGEISNVTYQNSGHIYFSIKDEDAILSCVMFKWDTPSLNFRLKTGDRIIALGSISLYEPQGKYQLIAKRIKLSGEGDLFKKFLELKEELKERGMFDEQYKRPIPKYIKTLGVVTSPTGAAVRDIIKTAKKRNPFVSIILYPALVQGEGSALSIAEGIRALDNYGVDVMIVGRGGGSIEDLWAFNEEPVINAIFASATPVISAVGHETDTTISDYVADLRAVTPTAGAQAAVFDYWELKEELETLSDRLNYDIESVFSNKKQKALAYSRHLNALAPIKLISIKKLRLIEIKKRMDLVVNNRLISSKNYIKETNKKLDFSINNKLNYSKEHLKRTAAGLSALSPAARLAQGYSYVTDSSGKNIYKKDDVNLGDEINIRVTDGEILSKVMEVK